MGLDIKCINKDYKRDEEIGIMFNNDCYISYFGFKDFRDKILQLYTDIPDVLKIDDYIKNPMAEEDGSIFIIETFDRDKKLRAYDKDNLCYNELLKAKEKYPKYYPLHALVRHSDCDGEIPAYQCAIMIEPLKQLKIDFKEKERKRFEIFIPKLIELMEEAVRINGMLFFI